MNQNLASVYITDLSAWCKIDFEGANSTGGFNGSSNPLYKGAKLYLNNEELTELVIPDDITEIKCGTFYGCSSLTSVTIGDNVTELGWYTFSNCPSLTSAKIGDGVTEIGYLVFSDCPSLSKISFGKCVEKIGILAFKNASITECYSYNPIPPVFTVHQYGQHDYENDTFYRAIEEDAVLYVPKEGLSKYTGPDYRWRDYFNIEVIE